ncbi:MAG: type II toxin-antitoxin system RelE/ParE family toxin [Betaproteobacteria bacterium]|nr:type II toxin-antitoxin system RelE/ParE family toxin [Betaproteobacteria bacterium]
MARAGKPACCRPLRGAVVGRVLFLVGKRVIVLHAVIKKTQRTPDRELKLARRAEGGRIQPSPRPQEFL